jgi:UDP-N-acetyl-D-glucosamine dehydrogenase
MDRHINPTDDLMMTTRTVSSEFIDRSGSFDSMAKAFVDRCHDKTIVVGILGLGYVGLPLAEAFVRAGIKVMGFDIDQTKITNLIEGRSYIRHIDNERVEDMMTSKLMQATTDFSRLPEADALLMCVPTPLNMHREPDLTYVRITTEVIAKYLRPSQLVVLESTTYPGTSDEVIIPILEQGSGLKCGVDFAVAYSPEREDPGNPHFCTTSIPKVVGANTDPERDMALALYGAFAKTVPVSDLKTAEAVKLSENIFRLINIALANELKTVFGEMGIDAWEVIEAAKTKPFGYMAFYPGPGIGGHCIPIDPFYLSWKARQYGVSTRFIELSGDVTANLPRQVTDATANGLSTHAKKAINGARVLLMGIAYKKNIDDLRESPAIPIIEQLRKRGAIVDYYDPHIPATPYYPEHPAYNGMVSVELTAESAASYDCALIITDHDGVDYKTLLEFCPLIIDTRNATHAFADHFAHKIIKA